MSFRLSRSIIISARRRLCRSADATARFDRPLELRSIGKAREVVGARLFCVLACAVEGDSDLVRHGGDELQVARFKGPGQARGDGHRAEQHSFRPELGADRAPLPRDASTRDSAGPVETSSTLIRPDRPESENSSSSPGCMPIVLASLSRAPSRTHTAPAWSPAP